MKTKKIVSLACTAMLLVVSSAMFTSCTKEGPEGPAGKDGTNGTDGIDGTNGIDANAISASDQAAYDAADGAEGARIYDHPLNYIAADQTKYPNAYTNFYRCKSCHGWDLLGKQGVLINKTPSATYPVAADVNLYTWARQHNIKEVFDAVKSMGGRYKTEYNKTETSYNSSMPDYSKILTDAQIWDVVKFLRETSHNIYDFYDMSTSGVYPTGTKTFSNAGKGGSAANGKVVYDAKCKGCHGADGKTIDIYCKGLFLGEMFRDDLHEIQHKAIWGMPSDREHLDDGCSAGGGTMPIINITDQDIRDLMVMGQDTVLFPW